MVWPSIQSGPNAFIASGAWKQNAWDDNLSCAVTSGVLEKTDVSAKGLKPAQNGFSSFEGDRAKRLNEFACIGRHKLKMRNIWWKYKILAVFSAKGSWLAVFFLNATTFLAPFV